MKNYKDIKTIAKEIRTELKKAYKGFKFSVTIERYSMGQSLTVNVMEAPFQICEDGSTSKQVNHVWLEKSELFTQKGKALLKKITEIANRDNWDNSDSMTDYFDVNFYFHLEVGKWNKPFQATGGAK